MITMKIFSLALLTVQNGLTPLIFRAALTSSKSEERFDVVEAVLVQECLKLFLSIILLFGEEGRSLQQFLSTITVEIINKPKETLKLAIPAFLYFVQNVCLQLASANLPAAVFQVTYQGKSLIVALCSVVLLSKKLTRFKWAAIGLMGFGLSMVQLSKNTETNQSSMANAREQSVILGLLFTAVAASCSGFAGVYFEKMMKQPTTSTNEGGKKPSMWVRNIQLAAFSILIGLVNLVLIRSASNNNKNTKRTMFEGFNGIVWIMVFNNALGGLCVAMVIKYADNILKGFACAAATLWASIASVYLYGFELHFNFLFGMLIVLLSTLMYGGSIKISTQYWNDEPNLCTKLRKDNNNRYVFVASENNDRND